MWTNVQAIMHFKRFCEFKQSIQKKIDSPQSTHLVPSKFFSFFHSHTIHTFDTLKFSKQHITINQDIKKHYDAAGCRYSLTEGAVRVTVSYVMLCYVMLCYVPSFMFLIVICQWRLLQLRINFEVTILHSNTNSFE